MRLQLFKRRLRQPHPALFGRHVRGMHRPQSMFHVFGQSTVERMRFQLMLIRFRVLRRHSGLFFRQLRLHFQRPVHLASKLPLLRQWCRREHELLLHGLVFRGELLVHPFFDAVSKRVLGRGVHC